MLPKGLRDRFILLFVAVWLALFHYESLRLNYLSSLVGRELPKFKFLFPPAGWIMFYRVDSAEVRTEVYGLNNEDRLELIDPHRIFNNQWIGYDNIRRNVLISVMDRYSAPHFCRYLKRKFPEYARFSVFQVVYPNVIENPKKRVLKLAYEC